MSGNTGTRTGRQNTPNTLILDKRKVLKEYVNILGNTIICFVFKSVWKPREARKCFCVIQV